MPRGRRASANPTAFENRIGRRHLRRLFHVRGQRDTPRLLFVKIGGGGRNLFFNRAFTGITI